jgi:hypothetical protein
VRFTVNRVALGQIIFRIFRVFCVSIIPQMLHTQLRVALTRRTNGRRLGTYQKALSEIVENLV